MPCPRICEIGLTAVVALPSNGVHCRQGGLGAVGGIGSWRGVVVSRFDSFGCSNGGPQCDGSSSGVFGGSSFDKAVVAADSDRILGFTAVARS